MKKIIRILLPILLITSNALRADNGEWLQGAVDEQNALYNTGPSSGCQDCMFNSVSASMIGWGIGLAAAICLITGLIHSDKDKK